MNSSTLRRFWSLIEEISSETLLKLEDKDLVKELLNQLDHKYPLNSGENLLVESYINSKTLLIRQIVESCLV